MIPRRCRWNWQRQQDWCLKDATGRARRVHQEDYIPYCEEHLAHFDDQEELWQAVLV